MGQTRFSVGTRILIESFSGATTDHIRRLAEAF